VQQVVAVDAFRQPRRGGARYVGVDPGARCRLRREMAGHRHPDVARLPREDDIAHPRAPIARYGGGSAKVPAIASHGIEKAVKSATLSGTSRNRPIMSHCPSRIRGSTPVASAAAKPMVRRVAGRSRPSSGSTIEVRPVGSPVSASRTPTARPPSARTYRV